MYSPYTVHISSWVSSLLVCILTHLPGLEQLFFNIFCTINLKCFSNCCFFVFFFLLHSCSVPGSSVLRHIESLQYLCDKQINLTITIHSRSLKLRQTLHTITTCTSEARFTKFLLAPTFVCCVPRVRSSMTPKETVSSPTAGKKW